MLILKATGLFYVLFLEALRYNVFSWASFSLTCQKNQTGQKKGFWGLWSVPLLECGRELGTLNLGPCEVDTKLSDLDPFECVQCPRLPGELEGHSFWSLAP